MGIFSEKCIIGRFVVVRTSKIVVTQTLKVYLRTHLVCMV